MKKTAIFSAVILAVLIKSQTISDYKYILIPQEFSDFKESKSFGLATILQNSLRAKKYIILTDTKNQWPVDALSNPCKVLNVEVLDDKSMFRNKVILEFKNCNNQVIFTQKGGSIIKEFEPGFQDALKQSLLKVPLSSPSTETEKLIETKHQELIKIPEETNIKEHVYQTSTAKKYTNGKLTLQKIQIDDNQFILVDGNSSVPFATFKSTAKKDVYRVKLSSGEVTIGYYENGNLIIEIPKSSGEFSNEVFYAN